MEGVAGFHEGDKQTDGARPAGLGEDERIGLRGNRGFRLFGKREQSRSSAHFIGRLIGGKNSANHIRLPSPFHR